MTLRATVNSDHFLDQMIFLMDTPRVLFAAGAESVHTVSECLLVGALWGNIYICVFCYNCYHGNALKGFLALWVNSYICVYYFGFSHYFDRQFTAY
jgi:hypothetical protein